VCRLALLNSDHWQISRRADNGEKDVAIPSDEERNTLDRGRMNLAITEGIFGAVRAKLPDDVCGMVMHEEIVPCFVGHGRFDDEELWEENWNGPDFAAGFNEIFFAEEHLVERGWHASYVRTLGQVVCPDGGSRSAGLSSGTR
jgi:hypothetical protein